jgi:hypothetical protein
MPATMPYDDEQSEQDRFQDVRWYDVRAPVDKRSQEAGSGDHEYPPKELSKGRSCSGPCLYA